MGPMMIQQRARCSRCNGQGYELTPETCEIEVHIPPGGRHGESVTVTGEGNQYPGHEAGDVVFQLRQGKHEVFTRKGADLGMSHTLSLREALCGYNIKIQHVSGHILIVSSKEGEIVQPGCLKKVYSYGMPIRYQAHTKGHLYIAMDVKLPAPNSLSNAALDSFRKILPDIERDDDIDMEIDEKGLRVFVFVFVLCVCLLVIFVVFGIYVMFLICVLFVCFWFLYLVFLCAFVCLLFTFDNIWFLNELIVFWIDCFVFLGMFEIVFVCVFESDLNVHFFLF